MEKANITIALGGDRGNTVFKGDVTAAEIAVLRAIHGNDAVFDVEPTGSVDMSNRQERARLQELYKGARNEDGDRVIELLYPGAAARVFESIDELELDESLMKPVQRAKGGKAPAKERTKRNEVTDRGADTGQAVGAGGADAGILA